MGMHGHFTIRLIERAFDRRVFSHISLINGSNSI